MKIEPIIAAWGLAVGIAIGACADVATIDDPDHCAVARGDASCADRFPDGSRPYCVLGSCASAEDNSGCFAERPADDECYSPCGDKQSILDDDACLDEVADDSGDGPGPGENDDGSQDSSPEDDGEGSDDATPSCSSDADCPDPTAPVCGADGECGPCTAADEPDTLCAERFAELPVCTAGGCVACTATNPGACVETETPVCDIATSECRGCVAHLECPESACNLATGACLPADRVWHVDGDGGWPFTTITEALEEIGVGESGTIIVHELTGSASYQESVTVSDRTVAILAASSEDPRWEGLDAAPTLRVELDATLMMDGMILAGNSQAEGVLITGSKAFIDRSQIVQNNRSGIAVLADSELRLVNSMVGRNGDDFEPTTGLLVQSSTVDVLYSSLVGNQGESNITIDGVSIDCDIQSSGTVRNSIVLGLDLDSISCVGLEVSHSAVDADGWGDTNLVLDDLSTAWFAELSAGDLHVTSSGAARFGEIARWQAGDPTTDVDGDPRPNTDGSDDLPGADVP